MVQPLLYVKHMRPNQTERTSGLRIIARILNQNQCFFSDMRAVCSLDANAKVFSNTIVRLEIRRQQKITKFGFAKSLNGRTVEQKGSVKAFK